MLYNRCCLGNWYRSRFNAICTNIFCRRTVTSYKGITYRSNCTKRYRNSHANVLTDGKRTISITFPHTGNSSRGYHRIAAAFGKSGTGLRKWSDGNRNTHGSRLIANSRTGLIFCCSNSIFVHHKRNLLFSQNKFIFLFNICENSLIVTYS